ncbi:uncharacterized protein LOC112504441 [Cynara cardunculus var. scolymus]|uniref:uncharacterized protein LOC112504441 n=1 Tax=Cynara cardunculus var. scolymus TaxID=59895 RepID=UPI000D630DC5|nr:uncharacterized protein LOC112504441 [Cynara cardunculus var. scolymus]
MDRLSQDHALEVGLLQARSPSVLEKQMDIIALSLDNLFSSHVDDKEGEKDLDAAVVPTTESEAEVVDDTITTHEANEAKVVDDAIRADAKSYDEDLPITPAADASDEEDEDENDDDEDDSPFLSDAGKDLDSDDDENDDDEDFTIQ